MLNSKVIKCQTEPEYVSCFHNLDQKVRQSIYASMVNREKEVYMKQMLYTVQLHRAMMQNNQDPFI